MIEKEGSLPIWTGASKDPVTWGNYRYAIQGYCAMRGLGTLLLPQFKAEEIPHSEYTDKNTKLMGVLLLTTRDVAGLVVRSFADEGNGVEAWRALISRYGNDSMELRRARQIEHQRMLESTECMDRDGILDIVHTADHLFEELEKLGCPLPESYKINFLMLRIRDIAPEIYTSVAARTDISYDHCVKELKNLSAYNTAIDRANLKGIVNCYATTGKPLNYGYNSERKMEECESKGNRQERYWKAERNQCYWCLKFGHNVQQCRKRLAGQNSTRRPDGSYYKGEMKKGKGTTKKSSNKPESFIACSFHLQAEDKRHETSTGDGLWLIDSGCNQHMSPYIDDFNDITESETTCTFGNKGKVKAKGMGTVKIRMKEKSDSGYQIYSLHLTNVLHVPELSTRLISSGRLRRAGGKFTESNENGSELTLPNGKVVIPLTQRGDFIWLETVPYSENSTINTVYTPGDRDSTLATLTDWHEILGHSHSASILQLEKRGLIKIRGRKLARDFNCSIC